MEGSMSQLCRVALDAMGGDNAPGEIVKGAVNAINAANNIEVNLVGKQEIIAKELKQYKYNKNRIKITDARDIIETGDSPVMSVRRKKDSSLVKALYLVKNGEADAFISAGSSGAIIVGGQAIVGKIKGVERPPLAPLIPTAKGVSILVDSGGNVDARSSFLVQWAKLGSMYMEHVIGIKKPKVAIVNVGVEEEKGNALVKETYPLLKACKDINFIGSIEARDIPNGDADVIVCDAFVGNVILKLYEGTASTLIKMIKGCMMKTTKTKIGALLIKKTLKQELKKMDATEYGGAPMIGLNGLVVKVHGNAKAKEIKNALLQCVKFKQQNINKRIAASMQKDTLQTSDNADAAKN